MGSPSKFALEEHLDLVLDYIWHVERFSFQHHACWEALCSVN